MSMTQKHQKVFEAIRDAVTAASSEKKNSSEFIIGILPILPAWKPDGVYATDDIRDYNNYPYRCGIPHRASDYQNQNPENLPALWWPYHGTTPETALPWRQPTGAHDTYKTNEYMIWGSAKQIMRCKSTTNFSPDEYSAAWEVV